jgi:hypothetical protein
MRGKEMKEVAHDVDTKGQGIKMLCNRVSCSYGPVVAKVAAADPPTPHLRHCIEDSRQQT